MPRVFLSAGHGGSDPGACGNGLRESDMNLTMLLACKDELEKHGVEVVASRVKDEDDNVRMEVKEANNSKADLAFSIHNNAGGGDGFECFYYEGGQNGSKLCKLVEDEVKKLGQNSRGIKKGNHLYFIRNTSMEAVLVEGCFVDNKTDIKIANTVEKMRKFGVAYAKAILKYLNIDYKEEQVRYVVTAEYQYLENAKKAVAQLGRGKISTRKL